MPWVQILRMLAVQVGWEAAEQIVRMLQQQTQQQPVSNQRCCDHPMSGDPLYEECEWDRLCR